MSKYTKWSLAVALVLVIGVLIANMVMLQDAANYFQFMREGKTDLAIPLPYHFWNLRFFSILALLSLINLGIATIYNIKHQG